MVVACKSPGLATHRTLVLTVNASLRTDAGLQR